MDGDYQGTTATESDTHVPGTKNYQSETNESETPTRDDLGIRMRGETNHSSGTYKWQKTDWRTNGGPMTRHWWKIVFWERCSFVIAVSGRHHFSIWRHV